MQFNELQSDFDRVTSKEQSLQKITRQIALYNLIATTDFIDDRLIFATVKVFRDIRRFLNTYPAHRLAETTLHEFTKNSQIFAIDVHMSKSIENMIVKHNWFVNITIESDRGLKARTNRLKTGANSHIMIVENAMRSENTVRVYLLLEREKNVPFRIHLRIEEMTTNIFNYLHVVDSISGHDLSQLKSFSFDQVVNMNEIYELCLKQFYYNLSASQLAAYNDADVTKWPATIAAVCSLGDHPILMEFKFRKNTVSFNANAKVLKAIRDFLVRSTTDRGDKYAALSLISSVRKLRNMLKFECGERFKDVLAEQSFRSELKKLLDIFYLL